MKNDGGPAFGHGSPEHGGDPGMSLRDWFAGQAIVGQLSRLNPGSLEGDTAIHRDCARGAYKVADALLSAREQNDDR